MFHWDEMLTWWLPGCNGLSLANSALNCMPGADKLEFTMCKISFSIASNNKHAPLNVYMCLFEMVYIFDL